MKEKRILIIVDEQNDFIDGPLGSEEAKLAVKNTITAVNDFFKFDEIICTLDTHDSNYALTYEGLNLPVEHCVKGTDGWELNKELKNALNNFEKNGGEVKYIEKEHFGTTKWESNMEISLDILSSKNIAICGLCTDICVISNALILRAGYNKDIFILKDCCAGTSIKKHEAALSVMESCQIKVI